jgi:hypothetical protein
MCRLCSFVALKHRTALILTIDYAPEARAETQEFEVGFNRSQTLEGANSQLRGSIHDLARR